ncbi:MAG TPA: hypothetical protein VK039_06280, partial [Brevibacterium sp.]|nr:hypothetical protein [Brevibacterium sp.]
YTLRADADGRLEITGRMAGAMHDPIVPGRRTRHFRAFGADAVTRVTIDAAVEPGEDAAREGRDAAAALLPHAGHTSGTAVGVADAPTQNAET